ncbi:MAG: VOC family protein [Defluviitaleaceae bacterium]|nr:VOC family protein [Defluviitaleaceae bacterium]
MLIPTIHFAGNCNDVIEFYKQTVGAEVQMVAYAKDAPADFGAEIPPNFVMHSEIKIFGTVVALTDGCEKPPTEDNHTFTVIFDTTDEVADVFNKLAEGGKVVEPLSQQFWADLTGMLTDRYGVNWNILTRSMPK